MNKRELIESYHEWLSGFKWNWFGTLTFRGFPPVGKARRCFDSWINELEHKYGQNDFRWFRVTERGITGSNIHFHVLIGGLRLCSGSRYLAMSRWQQLAGEANITSFVPHKNGIFYILKTLQPAKDVEIDFHLDPIGRRRP
jgi:hypothetical protein